LVGEVLNFITLNGRMIDELERNFKHGGVH
jgi:hypothetical protein